MDLINKNEIADFLSIGGVKMPMLAGLLMNLLSINRINECYKRNIDKSAIDFIDAVLSEFGVHYEIDEKELKNLPKEGAFISVSNHPFGGIEGLILLRILLSQRPDAAIMANFLLKKIKPISPHVLAVNPFESYREAFSSVKGIKESLKHLKEGRPIGIFPAGEVSSFQTHSKRVTDREWQSGVLKLIQHAQVPVVPIFFKGNNSLIFHLLGYIHPLLRTAKLPSEMLNKGGTVVKIRIGKPIAVADQQAFKSVTQLGRFLRAKTYALGSSIEVKRFFKPSLRALKKPSVIVDAIGKELLEAEIDKIRDKSRIHSQKEFEIFIAHSSDIPNILYEIGRLREITFRQVGEGTNRSSDLDEFDLYYHHLFLWDKEAKAIVGAYRLGKGNDIMEMYGKSGFYIQTLFKLDKAMNPILRTSIELGRSFVAPEYQKKILPLFLLWKGILYFLIKNPEYRYLIGPVSISNQFSNVSKGLIIEFVKRNFYRADLAEHVKPRKKFKPAFKQVDAAALLEKSGADMKELDKFIHEIESERFNIPVLLKKYMKQNARIIGFNVDPKFEMALDGLMILDFNDVPEETIQDLKKDFELR